MNSCPDGRLSIRYTPLWLFPHFRQSYNTYIIYSASFFCKQKLLFTGREEVTATWDACVPMCAGAFYRGRVGCSKIHKQPADEIGGRARYVRGCACILRTPVNSSELCRFSLHQPYRKNRLFSDRISFRSTYKYVHRSGGHLLNRLMNGCD